MHVWRRSESQLGNWTQAHMNACAAQPPCTGRPSAPMLTSNPARPPTDHSRNTRAPGLVLHARGAPSRRARGAARLQEYEAALHDGHERLVAPGVPVELVRRKLGVGLHVHQLRAARARARRRDPATGGGLGPVRSVSGPGNSRAGSRPALRLRELGASGCAAPPLLCAPTCPPGASLSAASARAALTARNPGTRSGGWDAVRGTVQDSAAGRAAPATGSSSARPPWPPRRCPGRRWSAAAQTGPPARRRPRSCLHPGCRPPRCARRRERSGLAASRPLEAARACGLHAGRQAAAALAIAGGESSRPEQAVDMVPVSQGAQECRRSSVHSLAAAPGHGARRKRASTGSRGTPRARAAAAAQSARGAGGRRQTCRRHTGGPAWRGWGRARRPPGRARRSGALPAQVCRHKGLHSWRPAVQEQLRAPWHACAHLQTPLHS